MRIRQHCIEINIHPMQPGRFRMQHRWIAAGRQMRDDRITRIGT
jgi:hypothetical protein